MGGLCSDLKGGQQAVGAGTRGDAGLAQTIAQSEVNDAVGHVLDARGLAGLYTPLELSLAASNLRDRDVLSKSDPMAVLYIRKGDGVLEELGRTEVIMNSLSPSWITKFDINYQFEIVQTLVIQVYDIDTKYHNQPTKVLKLNDQDYLGEASCALSEILTKPSRSLTLNLQSRKLPTGVSVGTITIHAEDAVTSRKAVEMMLRCSHLENKDLFSKSDPFLRILRIVENGNAIPICKTEVKTNNLNPSWKAITLTTPQFVSKENPLIIECLDFNDSGNHALIGKLQTSMADLEKLNQERIGANFFVQSSSRPEEKKMLKGQLFVDKFVETTQYTFLDYISNGFELNFMVAVDFTASNGDPRHPSSLHYIDPSGRLNSYQQAIVGVGEVLQFYDSDRRFPAWGFGVKTLDGSVSHCFNLNGAAGECEVTGIEGIMSSYAAALHNVKLSGPTFFSPVINKAAEIASRSQSRNQNKYFILLIITDGVVTDLQDTMDAIVRASDLPLSILIIGVGGADFTEMEFLDADTGKRLQSSTGRIATRDIVQFVPMREVHGDLSMVHKLLEELPGQFLTFVRSRDIKPAFVYNTEGFANK